MVGGQGSGEAITGRTIRGRIYLDIVLKVCPEPRPRPPRRADRGLLPYYDTGLRAGNRP